MKKNDSIELKIEDMGVDGEGIGKYEGMTFFVKDAVIGDTIRAGITKPVSYTHLTLPTTPYV